MKRHNLQIDISESPPNEVQYEESKNPVKP